MNWNMLRSSHDLLPGTATAFVWTLSATMILQFLNLQIAGIFNSSGEHSHSVTNVINS
jgi:hypothetical protein